MVLYLPQLAQYFPSSANKKDLVFNVNYNRDFNKQFKHYCLMTVKYHDLLHFRSSLEDRSLSQKKQEKKKSENSLVVSFSLADSLKAFSIPWDAFNAEQSFASDAEKLDRQRQYIEQAMRWTYKLVYENVLGFYQAEDAFPELVHPVYALMKSLNPHHAPVLSMELQSLHLAVLESIEKKVESIRATRLPLQWRKRTDTMTAGSGGGIELKAPKYDINYVIKRDRDAANNSSDKEKLKLKQLQRQLKREKKAAMRELRRDADFIENEQYQRMQRVKEAKQAERQKNFAWLEEQQASINQQVKKGKGLMKGGGSGVAKKPTARAR